MMGLFHNDSGSAGTCAARQDQQKHKAAQECILLPVVESIVLASSKDQSTFCICYPRIPVT